MSNGRQHCVEPHKDGCVGVIVKPDGPEEDYVEPTGLDCGDPLDGAIQIQKSTSQFDGLWETDDAEGEFLRWEIVITNGSGTLRNVWDDDVEYQVTVAGDQVTSTASNEYNVQASVREVPAHCVSGSIAALEDFGAVERG